MRAHRPILAAIAAVLFTGCVRGESPEKAAPKPPRKVAHEAKPAPHEATAGVKPAIAADAPPPGAPDANETPAAPKPPSPERYAWLASASADFPKAHDTLEERFATPKGFARMPVAEGSFGAWLRALPLAAPGTPVVTHTGKLLHDASHPNVAAVVAIDVGKGDLQQCADSVIRMHAEWLWSKGRRDAHYKAASGLVMSFAKYVAGERLSLSAGKLVAKKVAPVLPATHAAYRSWLDEVFGWANTASLATEAKKVALADLSPGDFVVMPGSPFGHAVLVLDVARAEDGRRVLLLGQGFMPAQSFHVLRPTKSETWFALDEASGTLETPFWEPFPFSTLRRLGE